MGKEPQIDTTNTSFMVNWQAQTIWCNSCNEWIKGYDIMIDGRHDMTGNIQLSAHTVWEK